MAFLQYIRTHKPEEYLRCRLTILHVLCDAVHCEFPVSMPRAVFVDKQKRGTYFFTSSDEELAKLIDAADDYSHMHLVQQMTQEARKISPEAEDLLHLKANGYSNREAAQMLGKTEVQVSRILKQLRNALNVG